MFSFLRKNFIIILIGILITFFLSWVNISQSEFVHEAINKVNYFIADNILLKNLSKLPPISKGNISIIAIDDKSLKEQGRWPWSRKKMATLLSQLQGMGATVVALDVIFSEPEQNPIDTILDNVKNPNANQVSWLNQIKPKLDNDQIFSDIIAKNETILGFTFNPVNPQTQGNLPKPLDIPYDNIFNTIPEMQGYLASTPKLSKASQYGGFLNSDPDENGILRQSSLILRYNDKLYPSLALAAIKQYLLIDSIELVKEPYGDSERLEGIKLDELIIPTDAMGRVWIPYREGAYAYPFFSATDILNNKIDKKEIADRLIFIGVTATGLGDLHPTPLDPAYPGVEVHASIAGSIIDKYLPQKPVWDTGLELVLIILCGVIGAFLFPILNTPILLLLIFASTLIWYFLSEYIWIHDSDMLTMIFPLISIISIALINMVNSYLIANRQKKEIKSAFGQYVPKEHIENILSSSMDKLLNGESKEISVLFSDIRGFTTMSEKLSPSELKEQLNTYLTNMTKVIFDNQGTIDKYVGDMIMAFWNAPLTQEKHAQKAIVSALGMHEQLNKLNKYFTENELPTIGIGVGINTTTCNIGDMGSEYRRAYTAIGDGVNLASRLEALCRLYNMDIIVGDITYQQTKDDFAYLHLDKVEVKGKNVPENIYAPITDIENQSTELKQLIEKHQQALNHYFSQNWKQAKEEFTSLLETSPYKTLCKLFITRIETFEKNPPEKDWNGSYKLTSK